MDRQKEKFIRQAKLIDSFIERVQTVEESYLIGDMLDALVENLLLMFQPLTEEKEKQLMEKFLSLLRRNTSDEEWNKFYDLGKGE